MTKIALGMERSSDKIVDNCIYSNITAFDTALAYGTESLLKPLGSKSIIVTKVPKGENVLESYKKSAGNLGKYSWHGLIMHHSADYTMDNYSDLKICKIAGYVKKIGVSVYDPEDIPWHLPFDIIQFPLSILDQRFIPYIPMLKSRGVEIWVRSVFLKGVLLTDTKKLPDYFNDIKHSLCSLPMDLKARIGLLLQFVRDQGVDYMIMGFENVEQMKEMYSYMPMLKSSDYANPNCIDPRRWPK